MQGELSTVWWGSADWWVLVIHLDEGLTMKQHVAKVAALCFDYHLRRLRQIRRRVGAEVTSQPLMPFDTPRLDYCNSVLAGLPPVKLEPLQLVQNAAVTLILDLNLFDHVTPGLRQLYCCTGCLYVGVSSTSYVPPSFSSSPLSHSQLAVRASRELFP